MDDLEDKIQSTPHVLHAYATGLKYQEENRWDRVDLGLPSTEMVGGELLMTWFCF